MAHPAPVTCLSLFSGIGGLDEGVRLALGGRVRVLGYCEREAYAAAVLLARMEDSSLEPAPVWCGDLAEMDLAPFVGVDLVTAGAPCQPYSVAGQRKGTEDERYLWPAIFRTIETVRPAMVFLENVPGLLAWFRPIGEELCRLGYELEGTLVRASDVGAPHKRERLFILAYRPGGSPWGAGEWGEAPDDPERVAHAGVCAGRAESAAHRGGPEGWRGLGPGLGGGDVANAQRAGLEVRGSKRGDAGRQCAALERGGGDALGYPSGGGAASVQQRRQLRGAQSASTGMPPFPPGPDDAEGWARVLAARPDLAPATERPLRRVAHELQTGMDVCLCPRTDRLRAMGNAVLPLQASAAFRELYARLR